MDQAGSSIKKKKKPRKLMKLPSDDDSRPLNSGPAESDKTLSDQTKMAFDQLLKAAAEQSESQTKRKKGTKTKSKRKTPEIDEEMMESLRQAAAIKKDSEDSAVLLNTYNEEDSPRFHKNSTNAKGRKLPPKKGKENLGYLNDDTDAGVANENQEPVVRQKKKKKKLVEEIEMDSKGPMSLSDLEQTPKKSRRKKKTVKDGEENGTDDEKQSREDTVEGEEGEEEAVKAKVKKKKKKKKKIDEPERIPDNGQIIGVKLHRSDRLKTDIYIQHPLVRVHFVDSNTGAYVKKSSKDRAVTSYFETQNDHVDFILPVLTKPFDFKKRKSLVPGWEEQIIFNESYLYLIQQKEDHPKVMLFFEILDFVSMNAVHLKPNMRSDGAWHRIAWGFLKLVGSNGEPNTERKVRLQLFYPPFSFKAKPNQVDVYQWWLNLARQPYPSTLYVTVKPVQPPEHVEPSSRSIFAIQEEQGTMTYQQLRNTIELGLQAASPSHQSVPTTWTRLPGQMCRVPNKPSLSLAGNAKGCFVMQYSPSGRTLACGCKDKEGYPIYIYEIPSGRLKCKFPGHYGIIYDLVWSSINDLILSASSDGTARLWNMNSPDSAAEKVFPHPAFVYCARFHSKVSHVIATGGYDHLLRVWSVENSSPAGELLQELEGHNGFVNALTFSKDGTSMYSGDSSGTIIVWNANVKEKIGEVGDWSIAKRIEIKEIEDVPINTLVMHPSGRRLLVHSRDNQLRMMDLRVFTIMQRYLGALNFREQLRSTLSACGTFVIAGSEDGQAYVWNTDTGDQVASYSNLGYTYPVCDVAFHPHEHMVAFCSRGESHPVKVFTYDAKHPKLSLLSRQNVEEREPDPSSHFPDESGKSIQAILDTKKLLTEELQTQKIERMERVKAKLASVVFQSPNSSPFRGGNVTFSDTQGTWGSTFDSAQFSLQSPTSGARGFGMNPRTRAFGNFSKTGTPHISMKASSGGKAMFTFNPDITQTKTSNEYRKVKALYDYTAQRSDELNILEGDIITVLHEDNENWWMGELSNGEQGYFPANYVEEEDPDHVPQSASASLPGTLTDTESPRRRRAREGRAKQTPDKSKFSAVMSRTGELKILSGAEESDPESPGIASGRKPRKKQRANASTDDSSKRSRRTGDMRKAILATNFQKGAQETTLKNDDSPRRRRPPVNQSPSARKSPSTRKSTTLRESTPLDEGEFQDDPLDRRKDGMRRAKKNHAERTV